VRKENIMEIHARISYDFANMRGLGKFRQNIIRESLKHAIGFEFKEWKGHFGEHEIMFEY
jgi:hypothetical protein